MRVILYSGGLDSLLLRLHAPDAQLVHLDYGQVYAPAEREAIERQVFDTSLQLPVPLYLTVPMPEPLPDGHVPHRNLALLAVAAAWTEPTSILLGGVRGETSPDKSAAFLRAASAAVSRSEGVPTRVEAPLRRRTKSQHLRSLVETHGAQTAQKWLDLTTSCYAPSTFGVGCGRCLACYRRWVAVTNAGLRGYFAVNPGRRRLDVRAGAGYLRRTPIAEWPGVLQNQTDALRARRRAAS